MHPPFSDFLSAMEPVHNQNYYFQPKLLMSIPSIKTSPIFETCFCGSENSWATSIFKHLLHGTVLILGELVIVDLQFIAEVTPEFLDGVIFAFHRLQQALHLFFVGGPLNRCRFSSVLMVL